MGVMAIRANNFAFCQRMVRYLLAVRTLLLVAGIADFSLCLLGQHRISRLVNLVAIVARNAIILMLRTVPMAAVSTLMTSQALAGTLFVIRNWESTLLKHNIWSSTAFDGGVTLDVLFAGTVARLTSGCTGITSNTMLGLVERQNGGRLALIVAFGAERIFSERLLCNCRF